MRASLLLSLWALGSATCQRVEEPAPPAPVADPPATATATATATTTATTPPPTPTATPDAGPCVAPLAEPPPPPAKPAAVCPADPVTTPPALATGTISFPEATGAPTIQVEV